MGSCKAFVPLKTMTLDASLFDCFPIKKIRFLQRREVVFNFFERIELFDFFWIIPIVFVNYELKYCIIKYCINNIFWNFTLTLITYLTLLYKYNLWNYKYFINSFITSIHITSLSLWFSFFGNLKGNRTLSKINPKKIKHI